MSEPIHLWLDDERPMPPGYTLHCRAAEQAIEAIQTGRVVRASLDFWLGSGYTLGIEVAEFIAVAAQMGEIPPMECRAHSKNRNACGEMNGWFTVARIAWAKQKAEVTP